jgi:hypothetical protein
MAFSWMARMDGWTDDEMMGDTVVVVEFRQGTPLAHEHEHAHPHQPNRTRSRPQSTHPQTPTQPNPTQRSDPLTPLSHPPTHTHQVDLRQGPGGRAVRAGGRSVQRPGGWLLPRAADAAAQGRQRPHGNSGAGLRKERKGEFEFDEKKKGVEEEGGVRWGLTYCVHKRGGKGVCVGVMGGQNRF